MTRSRVPALLACVALLDLGSGNAHATGWGVRHYPQLGKPVADVKLRLGPGAFFKQIDMIKRGELVVVQICARKWCQITQQDGGPGGYMTEEYMIFMGEIRG
ncbi:hypothetical protein [Jiella sonneratiae]|uniref:SH3 domain-containing protein n=1 Tax=Jiella sonneratiae TaxID=2816856 RepID=A0ABS3J9K1_9HYPH|nr:hypothetical protein [Jiella sonneratiae]MBO0906335.1 hypothetical protein [Jiella sonneratiae]